MRVLPTILSDGFVDTSLHNAHAEGYWRTYVCTVSDESTSGIVRRPFWGLHPPENWTFEVVITDGSDVRPAPYTESSGSRHKISTDSRRTMTLTSRQVSRVFTAFGSRKDRYHAQRRSNTLFRKIPFDNKPCEGRDRCTGQDKLWFVISIGVSISVIHPDAGNYCSWTY